jgi:hypothetical protein
MGPATSAIPGYVLDDIVRRTPDGPAARFASTAGEFGLYLLDGRLGEVTVPVELVWGDADQLMTMDYAQRMLDGLPRARLHPIKGCGHVPHRECPLRFLEVLRSVLEMPPVEAPEAAPEDVADEPDDDPGQQAGSLLHDSGARHPVSRDRNGFSGRLPEPPAETGLAALSVRAGCSAELQLGVDGDDACQNAELELGATKADSRIFHEAVPACCAGLWSSTSAHGEGLWSRQPSRRADLWGRHPACRESEMWEAA